MSAAGAALPWWRRFGRRNLGYLAACALLVPLGLAAERAGPGGPDAGGGLMLGFLAWAAISAMFMLGNGIAALRGGPGRGRALLGLVLPPLLVGLVLASEPVILALSR